MAAPETQGRPASSFVPLPFAIPGRPIRFIQMPVPMCVSVSACFLEGRGQVAETG